MLTTDAAKRIEMTYLHKNGYLCGWCRRSLGWTWHGQPSGSVVIEVNTGSFGPYYMELDYKARCGDEEDWRPMKYRVNLEAMPCRYGGQRWWFRCPNTRCGRRCLVLYHCGDYFVCRTCAGLKYESQSHSGKYRVLSNLFETDNYAMTVKRWYYRGKPTRKHRKYLRMTGGMSEDERLNACLAALRT